MTESEVRKLLRQMKELDSQTAFRDFYNMTYDLSLIHISTKTDNSNFNSRVY